MATTQALHPSQSATATVPFGQVPLTGLPHASADAARIPRGPTSATLNFYKAPEDGSKPWNYVEQPPAGQPQRNFGDEDREIQVSDARGREGEFRLDEHSFQLLQGYPHNEQIDWRDDESIKTHYYPEVEALLLKHAGAQKVVLFDHTIRRAEPNAHRSPVTRAHIDQTAKSAKQRVEFHSPDEADALLQGRYRIINVWRPLNGAVETFPLAFADSASVPDRDVVPVEHRYPDRTGETAAIRYSPEHKWWYWSGIDNEERILLQCFDSDKPGNRVPHSAFVDDRGSKPRESIEVRAMVYG